MVSEEELESRPHRGRKTRIEPSLEPSKGQGMGLIGYALRNGVAVSVMVAIIALIGLLSISRLPLQLFPEIQRPVMTVQTYWRSAGIEQMEEVIVEEQEQALRGLPGLEQIRAEVNPSFVQIFLTFGINADMQQMQTEVQGRLSRLPPIPPDAFLSVQSAAAGDSNDTLIYLFIQSLPGNSIPIIEQNAFINDVVLPRFENIEGVASAELQGPGNAPEVLEITFDPFLAAQYGVQIPQIAAAVGQSENVSGGFVDIGRRSFAVNFEGEFSPEQMEEQILDWRDGRPVRLGDIATVAIQRADRFAVVYQNGNPALGIRLFRTNGANVLSTIDAVKDQLNELNQGLLAERGLRMAHSYDPSVFILRAINLLTTNLAMGILLAVLALWLFLRRIRATLLIAITIPICMLVTFCVLSFFGRSLNVISLAGLAFATGMVLDAAIVVLESIVRQREKGLSMMEAAGLGASRVWNALVAATATTVAVFLPVIFLEDAEGQLFADLAFTVAIAVTASLVVALLVLPVAAVRFLKDLPASDERSAFWAGFARLLMGATGTPMLRRIWVVLLFAAPIAGAFYFAPALGYLPRVPRDAIDAYMVLPPGATLDTVDEEILQVVVERLQPYMDGEREPALRNYYAFSFPGFASFGVRPLDIGRIDELEDLIINEVLVGFPDTFAGGARGNLLEFGDQGSIRVEISSPDPAALQQAAQVGMAAVAQALGEQPQANPRPDSGQPTLRIVPDDRRISEAGWNRRQVSNIVRALGDGIYMGEYFDGNNSIDILLRSPDWHSPEELESIPLATPSGSIVPLGDLVDISSAVTPRQIVRVDGSRTITLNVPPPDGMALETAIETLRREVEPQIRAVLGESGRINYGGSASSLARVQDAMLPNIALAIGVLFLIMAGMFRSIKDSALVLVILPPAAFGGVAALALLSQVVTQELDLLAMIGFIILAGIVVNNAILLVSRTRQAEGEGLSRRDAVAEALNVRLRPIFMTTITTIMGMLPLVLVPGAGSAIYRGLGAVIVGGMSISTLFTLILLPSLLRLGERSISRARAGRRADGILSAAGE